MNETDALERLERLARHRDQELLLSNEFEARKAPLLGMSASVGGAGRLH
jgi:hypothetical protein